MKGQVDDAELSKRELLEVRLCRIGAQENGAWLRKVTSNRFDFVPTLWKRNKFAPLRPGDSSMDAGEKGVRRRIGRPCRHPDIRQIRRFSLLRSAFQDVKHGS